MKERGIPTLSHTELCPDRVGKATEVLGLLDEQKGESCNTIA